MLQLIFGNNNQKEWTNWATTDNNNNKSVIFINAINTLCRN